MKRNKLTCRGKSLWLVTLFTLVACIVSAQVRISGRVTDPDGSGVSGATILIKNTNAGTTTDNEGNYALTANLKNGQQTVQFSSVGFKTQERAFTITGSQTAFTFN